MEILVVSGDIVYRNLSLISTEKGKIVCEIYEGSSKKTITKSYTFDQDGTIIIK